MATPKSAVLTARSRRSQRSRSIHRVRDLELRAAPSVPATQCAHISREAEREAWPADCNLQATHTVFSLSLSLSLSLSPRAPALCTHV
mmetsp:Transcript_75062/g.199568  ORF Transcript_75062/g.199568 Transcript_75062/m.199568 type:complete len:88 (-) Transcript_75062:204-467(-)